MVLYGCFLNRRPLLRRRIREYPDTPIGYYKPSSRANAGCPANCWLWSWTSQWNAWICKRIKNSKAWENWAAPHGTHGGAGEVFFKRTTTSYEVKRTIMFHEPLPGLAKLCHKNYVRKKYCCCLTCFEKTAMSSLNDSDEHTSPPATDGSRGVQVANSHFSKINASRGKRGWLKTRERVII